ncbi:outer membrane beta-barrel protein [Arcticibacter tournemirensis]|uniref:Outer membrane protein beta-barrel domain-containing protein n=1 Tax=Arcticibacter tournemirensis TaxID=699437 RepID=A0A4Q0M7C4_9SPHI|nr:hypothetical protein [Arcticibacter tournemirensis]RXF68905.1 hypothetical protein EKH83_14380 [Arcticibacter tournemirensis]
MKKTIKLLTAASAIALLFSVTETKAQDSQAWRLGVGLNGGVGTKDPYGFVLGGDVKLQKDLAGPVSLTLASGFNHFFVKDEFDNVADPYNVVPLKAGVKAFLNKNFYVSGELGAGFGTDEGGETSFVWSPSIGWAFTNGLDIGVKYEDYTKYDPTKQVALRIAYGFNLSK